MEEIFFTEIYRDFNYLVILMEEQLHRVRHSLSHIMAQAIQRIQQADVEVAI